MGPGKRTLAEVGEFGLLRRLLPSLPSGRGVQLGPGDDCAVLTAPTGRLLFTVDALVEGVHFQTDWLTPRQLGRKAFLVNASDIAAMGGRPRWCVVNIAAPVHTAAEHLIAISRGVAAAAAELGGTLVGGNLSRARELSVTVALIGESPSRPITRSGARPGDLLFVSGRLGDAALGVRQLRARSTRHSAAVRRFAAPAPRVTLGAALARAGIAGAMIDISDGLLQDLGHLCAASQVGAVVELARVPCSPQVRRTDHHLALTGGEDYELLCAIPARHRRRLEALAARCRCPMTCIGSVVQPRAGVRVVDAAGRPVRVRRSGHDHFMRRGR
jgi:thiamine-monophosphate kinase